MLQLWIHKCRLMQACKRNAYSILTWVVQRIADARQYRAYALGSQQAIHARATELRGTVLHLLHAVLHLLHYQSRAKPGRHV